MNDRRWLDSCAGSAGSIALSRRWLRVAHGAADESLESGVPRNGRLLPQLEGPQRIRNMTIVNERCRETL